MPTNARKMGAIRWCCLVWLAIAVSTAGSAWAGRGPDPRQHEALADQAYQRGMRANKDGRYAEAAYAFEEAFAHLPDPALLWNIARAWEKAGELEKARDRYTEFLAHDDIDAKLRKAAGAALVRVGGKLQARQDAQSAEEMERLLRDEIAEAEKEKNSELVKKLDAELAKAQREITAKEAEVAKAQEEVAEKEARAAEAEAREAEARAQVATMVTARDEPVLPVPSWWGWVGVGAGVAAAGAGAVLLVVAAGERDDVREARQDTADGLVRGMTFAEARTLESDADTHATTGVSLVAVGGGLAALGVGLLLLGDDGADEEGVTLGVTPLPGGLATGIAGRF